MSEPATSQRIPAAPYVRVSDYKQIGGRFDSCEAQLLICREHIERNASAGWFHYTAEEFVDPAYTGGNMDRPGMRALKVAIAAGRIKIVVVYKLERVLRSTSEWSTFKTYLKQYGCQLVSASEGIAEDTAAARLKSNVIVSVAEYERDNIAEKVRSKLYQQAKKGFWNGGLIPFGYTYDLAKKMLLPDPIEAPLVCYIFRQAAALVSLTEVADDLNKRSTRTRVRTVRTRDCTQREVGGRRIRSDWLRLIIKNPLYRGAIRFKSEEFPGIHAAVVNGELWESANAAIAEKLKPAISLQQFGRDRHFNLLKGVAVCGDCRRSLVPHASGKLDPDGQPYRYYTCDSVLREGDDSLCGVRRINAIALEASVTGLLGQLARHPALVEAVLAVGRAKARTGLPNLDKQLAAVKCDIEKITDEVRNLVSSLATGRLAVIGEELRIGIESLKERKNTLLLQQTRLQQERDLLRHEQLQPQKICAALARFDGLWAHMSRDEKREVVNLLIASVAVHAPSKNIMAGGSPRALKIRVKLHLPELLADGQDASSSTRKKLLAIEATVQLPAGRSGEIIITAPFRHRIAAPVRAEKSRSKPSGPNNAHPIRRALALKAALDSNPTLDEHTLASQEGLSPSTVCQLLKLTRLCPKVTEALMLIDNRASAWRFSIRRLLPLIALSPADQWENLERIGRLKRERRTPTKIN